MSGYESPVVAERVRVITVSGSCSANLALFSRSGTVLDLDSGSVVFSEHEIGSLWVNRSITLWSSGRVCPLDTNPNGLCCRVVAVAVAVAVAVVGWLLGRAVLRERGDDTCVGEDETEGLAVVLLS